MLDFTSSLYLGMRHPSRDLAPWESLTTGAPAALAEPERYRQLARDLASLQGCESGALGTSTLHLFWDLFGMLAREPLSVFIDAGAYPIAYWGVERAGGRGAVVRSFPHHDAEALNRLIANRAPGRRPVVVVDGFCPACGRVAPLEKYLASVQPFRGLLVVDDTQALGVLGHAPAPGHPFGRGGGGTLPWCGLKHPAILSVASLAKGFGAPLAFLCGSAAMIGRFRDKSETRVHCSPPSQVAVQAALRALSLNLERGEFLRHRLCRTVARFQQGLSEAGYPVPPGIFPFQTLGALHGGARQVHQGLLQAGINALLHRPRSGSGARLSFIFTASHTPAMVDRALEAMSAAARGYRHTAGGAI